MFYSLRSATLPHALVSVKKTSTKKPRLLPEQSAGPFDQGNEESSTFFSLNILVIAITVKLFLGIGSKQNIIYGTLQDRFLV